MGKRDPLQIHLLQGEPYVSVEQLVEWLQATSLTAEQVGTKLHEMTFSALALYEMRRSST